MVYTIMPEKDSNAEMFRQVFSEAKKVFTNTISEEPLIRAIFKDLYERYDNDNVSFEPFVQDNKQGLLAKAQIVHPPTRLGSRLEVKETRFSYLPLLEEDENGNLTEMSESFITGMKEAGYNTKAIGRIILLFEGATAKLERSVPKDLIEVNQKNFTWELKFF